MSWRKQNSHREETIAVKRALKEANISFKSIGHDTGTAWGWLKINLGENPSGKEHIKTTMSWHCESWCAACKENREIERKVIQIVQEVTGRHGEYDGEIAILTQ